MYADKEIFQFIPAHIIQMIKKDYPYINELIKYKRYGTFLFLRSQGAITFFKGIFHLDVKCDVKNWQDFLEFLRDYIKLLVHEGLQKYQNDEKYVDNKKKKYFLLDMGILGPASEIISDTINNKYSDKFPNWPTRGTQKDFIELKEEIFQETNELRIYLLCRGTIFVQDTRYDYPKNGYNYRSQILGKPEFLLSYFNLTKIRHCNEIAKRDIDLLKKLIAQIEEKYLQKRS